MQSAGGRMNSGPSEEPGPSSQVVMVPCRKQKGYKSEYMKKVKAMIQDLKKQLHMLIRVTAEIVKNAGEGKPVNVREMQEVLERFFASCDRIEVHLENFHKCTLQQLSCIKHTPLTVVAGKSEPLEQEGFGTCFQLLRICKAQVNVANSLSNILKEYSTAEGN